MIKSPSSTSLASLEDGCLRTSSGMSSPSLGRTRSPSPAPSATAAAPRHLASPMDRSGRASHRRSLSTTAAIPPLLVESPTLRDAFQQEWEVQSTLHVNGFTAFQCGAEFGFPKVANAAPSLQAPAETPFERVDSFGACLATPLEMDRGSRAVAANFVGSRAYHAQEEVVKCMDRWSDWVRRIRRKRRLEQVQALLAMLDPPAAILKRDPSSTGPDSTASFQPDASQDEPEETAVKMVTV